MSRSVSFLVAVAALLPACGSSITSFEDHLRNGEWAWVRATGGIAGTEITPQTEGYDLDLRFGSDGTVELRKDGVLQVATTFEILPPSDEPGAPPHERIAYGAPILGGWEQQLLVRVDAETLTLSDPCCDGYVYEFSASR